MRLRLTLGLLAAASLHAASSGLRLDVAGSITSNPSEVVSGTRSIKGAYTGSGSFTNFLRGDAATLNLQPNQSYRVTFRYKVLATLDKGFNAFFVTGRGYQQGVAPVNTFSSQATPGTTGTATFTERLQNFDDYVLQWTIIGQGAVAVDDIQVFNASTGELIGSEDAEPGTALLSTFFVSANKPVFTWGEPVKVTASLRDENNQLILTGPATWTVDVPARATVAADGTVTPRAMQTFVVRGTLNGMTGEVRLQPVPKRVAVVAESSTMIVGATQRLRADVMDVNDRPIPGMAVNWSVSSLNFRETSNATIDQAGMLKSNGLAKVRVMARISYMGSIPGFLPGVQGETLVEIRLAPTYRFERIFVSKAAGAASSTLAPRPAQLIPTDTGFIFPASLDGLGSALLEWNEGSLKPLLVSGRVSIQSGYPLADFLNYTRSASGEVLVQEIDVGSGSLVSRGPAAGPIIPVASDGAPIFGAENTSGFQVSRNSLADSGAMLMQARYNETVTNRGATGLFRTVGRGNAELVVSTIDDRLDPADVPKSFFFPGIANDGTVWFLSWPQFVIWRCRPGELPRKMIAPGDTILGETVRSVVSNFSGTPAMFVASNGDAIMAVNTTRASYFLLYRDGDSAPSASVAVPPSGLYWYDPKVGALIDTNTGGRGRGLYLWNKDGVQPLLLLNATSLDGSPIQEILSASSTASGTIYVMASTADNPMVIARLSPDPAVLLKSGDSIPVTTPPVITALIPGKRSGAPLVLAGGNTGSVAQLDESGAVTPIVKVGVRLPDRKYFVGSTRNQVRTRPDGRIFFAQNLFANDGAIYSWDVGEIGVALRGPLTTAAGTRIGFPSSFEVNRNGDIAVRMTSGGFGTFFVRDGRVSPIVAHDAPFEGLDASGFNNLALDEAGNVLFGGNVNGIGPYFGVWDGVAARLVLTPETNLPDGRQASWSNSPHSCEDGFLAPMFGSYIRFRNGAWSYLADPYEVKANGTAANDLDWSRYDANRGCDVAFVSNYTNDLGTRANSKFQQIQDLNQLTVEGELLRVVQLLINDDGVVYVLGGNDRGEEVIYRATPIH